MGQGIGLPVAHALHQPNTILRKAVQSITAVRLQLYDKCKYNTR